MSSQRCSAGDEDLPFVVAAVLNIRQSIWFVRLAAVLALLAALAVGVAIPMVVAKRITGLELYLIVALLGILPGAYLIFKQFDLVVFCAFALFGFVQVEPAPVDVLIAPLLLVGFLIGRFSFKSLEQSAVIHLSLWVFTAINFISLFSIRVITFGSIRYVAITIYMLAILYFMRLYVTSENRMRIVLFGYLTSAVLNALLTLSGFIGLTPEGLFIDQMRGTGYFKDANVYGPFLMPVILLLIDEVWHPHFIKKHLWLKLTLIGLLVCGLFVSFSRAAWGSLVITILFYIAFQYKNLNWRVISNFFMIGAGGLAGLLVTVMSLGLIDFFFSRANAVQSYDSERFRAQYDGILSGLTNLFGVGPGRLDVQLFAPHSLYIRTFGEHGIIGFISFFTFVAFLIIILFTQIQQGDKKVLGLSPHLILAITLGILLNSFLVDTLHWRHFWYVLGLAWIVVSVHQKEQGRFLYKPLRYISRV